MTQKVSIRPFEFQVVVEVKKVEDRTAGGVYIPDQLKDREQHAGEEGIIVALSPVAFSYAEFPEDTVMPKVGDRVLFRRYAGFSRVEDDVHYRIMPDREIAAVLDEVSA